jgi:hypothetical protein
MSTYGEGGSEGETQSYGGPAGPGGPAPGGPAAGPTYSQPGGGYPPPPYWGATRVPGPPGFFEYGLRNRHPLESKPAYLTSEFWALLIGIAALAITAGSSDSVDARGFWVFATIMISAYILSRGIAKSGVKNRVWGPREPGPGQGPPPGP